MTIYKPKNSPNWHYDFQFRGHRYYGSTGCTSKREAERFERRTRHEVANPDLTRPQITVDEACGLYQDKVQDQRSWTSTRYMLRALVEGLGARRYLSEITQRDLQLYLSSRRAGRSNASVNRELDAIRALWNHVDSMRYDVGEKPNWSKLYLSVPRRAPRVLSESTEQEALFDAIADDAYDVVMFALISGWRRAEIIGLRWQDIDLGRAEAITRIKGGDVVVRPLNPALTTIIANQPRAGAYVFTYICDRTKRAHTDKLGRKHPARRQGKRYPMSISALRIRWEAARKQAELNGLRFHDLRHTAATRILRATQNLATTAKVLQHRNLKTTLRYAHVLDDDVRDALSAAQSRNIPELINRKSKKGE